MARLGSTASAAWTALMALTVGTGCGGTDAGGDPEGAGGAGAAGSGSTAAATSTTGTGSHSTFDCDPAAAPGSLYELEAVSYDINAIEPVSMCKYRGDVMLIVNTAAV